MRTAVKVCAALGLFMEILGLVVSRVDGVWALGGFVALVAAVFLLSVPAVAVLAKAGSS